MFTGFTVSGAALSLLHVGERGVIARVRDNTDPTVADQIRRLGLSPGTPITLEQRFPRFVVRTHSDSVALTQAMIQAIYVRTRAY
ncbi:FeoA domain superfamily [Synechococcus sp. PCC 7335]|uniref:ferrous iron transport protein A n=1 Tax=Synechococcus sp. (strain ATCC 29403 / PCC 7335) TaxID=91464 RepID=UPI00017EC070|nr:ferrous iron transport protein A [Synechococcus sp. PCC 7335]EDX86843.1 FeoA domain superfamily [Synechococcus sp. PCC 7335]